MILDQVPASPEAPAFFSAMFGLHSNRALGTYLKQEMNRKTRHLSSSGLNGDKKKFSVNIGTYIAVPCAFGRAASHSKRTFSAFGVIRPSQTGKFGFGRREYR